MAKQYPTIQAQEMIVDNTCKHMWLCRESVQFDMAYKLSSHLVLVGRRTTLSPCVLAVKMPESHQYCVVMPACTALPDPQGCS